MRWLAIEMCSSSSTNLKISVCSLQWAHANIATHFSFSRGRGLIISYKVRDLSQVYYRGSYDIPIRVPPLMMCAVSLLDATPYVCCVCQKVAGLLPVWVIFWMYDLVLCIFLRKLIHSSLCVNLELSGTITHGQFAWKKCTGGASQSLKRN